jgi:DNA-binding Lrp family transcriptional regulator
MKPDAVDTKILEALMEDGRASLRQIAQRTSLTTPTVSARFARMKKAGLIMKFVPILSAGSIDRGVLALVTLRVDPGSAGTFLKRLSGLPEVEQLYTTTGQNVALKLALEDVRNLEPFLKERVLGRPGVTLTSSEIVTGVLKEEQSSRVPSAMTMNLRCDYCDGQVTNARPYTMVVDSSHYYFCCKTCKGQYLEKHGDRLAKLR